MNRQIKKTDKVTIRMYCMGTGDCFIVKFFSGKKEKFTVMIDCGSCSGTAKDFRPYIIDLKKFVGSKGIDLLIVSHEHQDHVNGFKKCEDLFDEIPIREAWFAWTEDPKDPTGKAKELLEKRKKLRIAFRNAMEAYSFRVEEIEKCFLEDAKCGYIKKANNSFLNGLRTLADINLNIDDESLNKESLSGMIAILSKLKRDKAKIVYRNPGEMVKFEGAPGLKFYILGPPMDKGSVYKDGKEGKDVFQKHIALNYSMSSCDAYTNLNNATKEKDLPFDPQYVLASVDDPISKPGNNTHELIQLYFENDLNWRKIDYDWLTGVGSLAIRLDTHLNNTSLAVAIESEDSGNVILFPGDAEYGNWESWHLINDWKEEGRGRKPLVEDLLNRTVFYKVGHHSSYNGTALEKGINLMPQNGMAAMISLDRSRISSQWKSTMPNRYLLEELTKRCGGKVFMMSETEIKNPPSGQLNYKLDLDGSEYEENKLYKQYTFSI